MIVMPTLAEGEYSDDTVVRRTVLGFVPAVLAFVAIIIDSGSGVKGQEQAQAITDRKHGVTTDHVCGEGDGDWEKIIVPVYPHELWILSQIAGSRQDLLVRITIIKDAREPAEPKPLVWAVDI